MAKIPLSYSYHSSATKKQVAFTENRSNVPPKRSSGGSSNNSSPRGKEEEVVVKKGVASPPTPQSTSASSSPKTTSPTQTPVNEPEPNSRVARVEAFKEATQGLKAGDLAFSSVKTEEGVETTIGIRKDKEKLIRKRVAAEQFAEQTKDLKAGDIRVVIGRGAKKDDFTSAKFSYVVPEPEKKLINQKQKVMARPD